MPTVIFKVDCGKLDSKQRHGLALLENKVQEALTELDYNYLVFDTVYNEEALMDIEDLDSPATIEHNAQQYQQVR